jgi:aminodeoxyfutalosine deaminase
MSSAPPVFTLRADWVLPVAGEPIRGGTVVVRGERIASVGWDVDGPVFEHPEAVIVPGFVNAHTHLEFSDLSQPIAPAGTTFPAWIQAINALRRGRTVDPSKGIGLGLHESIHSGTTTLGEIETTGWAELAEPGIEVHRFRELIGLTEPRIQQCLTAAISHLHLSSRANESHGLSPHAPYTVHPRLLDAAIKLANQYSAPLAMHVAESREELQLLRTGSGPLRELLEQAGVWVPDAFHAPRRALDVLQTLSQAARALVIHGNYLDDDEIEFLADRRASMAVVYCPRTHAYFGHEPYPLATMLDRGVQLALGTDSRASNPDLSMLGEMRQVAAMHADVSPTRILELATLDGAKALGRHNDLGSLEAGKLANTAVMHAPTQSAPDPAESLLDPHAQVIAVYHRGQQAH